MICEAWECFKYREVFEIVEMRDGCVFKTRSLGYFTTAENLNFPTDKYILASISTSMRRQGSLNLDVRETP